MNEEKMKKLEKILEKRGCSIDLHANVMEMTFKKDEDAEWFEKIVEASPEDSAVSCLMTMKRLGNKKSRHRFVFNVTDMDNFIDLMDED
ncbi:MAG: hypothetical protein Q8M97_09760 [Methanobacteriaceae archaeon]|nr:hypothetical protein [Methanobacteriaceae archaeon]